MPAISPSVKPTFVVGLSSKSLSYLDTTNWASLSGSQVANLLSFLAILKVSGPNGAFYINPGYPSNSFASPDINVKTTNVKTGIPYVPVDANGAILSGQYSFYAKYKMNVANLVSADTGTKTFVLDPVGDFAILLNNLKSTTGVVFTIVGGLNAGTYTIVSATTGFLGTVVTVNEALPSAVVTGSSFWATIPEATNSIDYCYTIPEPVVEITSNCFRSELICKDATDYGSAGVVIVSRENRVKYPLTMETPAADIVSNSINVNQQLAVNPIYTHTWAGIITTNFTVDKTTYGLDITIKGLQEHTVDCDIRLCAAFTCIKTMVDQYNAYLGTNPTAASKLQSILFKVQDAYMLYSIAAECGNDAEACKQVDIIVDLIGSTGCNCGCTGSEDSGFAQLVLAVGNAEGGAMPLNYLEEDNITVNSNARVPSNKAVITYVAAIIANYYTIVEIDALLLGNFYTKTDSDGRFVRQFNKTNVATGISPLTLNGLSGTVNIGFSSPVGAGDYVDFRVDNTSCRVDNMVIAQISDQSGGGGAILQVVTVTAFDGYFIVSCRNISLLNFEDTIQIQFLLTA